MSNRATMNRTGIAIAAIMLFSSVPNGWSQTAPYPVKLVRIINPVAPGGNQDIVARAIAEQMTRGFGQQVIVESRPGSAAVVGTRYVKAAPPDGYTLLAISNTFARVPAIMADAGYDPLKDFAAISQTCDVPLVLVVNPALPVKTVQELIALAKRRPGELTSASSGVGSTGHVATEMFSRQAGIRMLHVQYKGRRARCRRPCRRACHAEVRSGDHFAPVHQLRQTARARREHAQTLPVLPDVPTIEEAGLAGFHDSTFNGLVAPAGTPRQVIERLRDAVAKAVAVTELRNRFLEQGIELIGSTSTEEFAAFLRKQVEEFATLARQAGMTAK